MSRWFQDVEPAFDNWSEALAAADDEGGEE